MGDEGGECIRGLGLVFTNPVGTGEVLEVCLCLGCGGMGGVGVSDGIWSRVWKAGDVLCFLPIIYLSLAESKILTRLRVVVGPGFSSTLPAFMRSSGTACPAYQKKR